MFFNFTFNSFVVAYKNYELHYCVSYREKYSSANDFLTLFAGHIVMDGKGNKYNGR